MPTTLTYGRKKPISGERGATVFTSLEDNITRDDAHSHNGTDSARLNPKDFSKTHTTLASGSWVAVAGQTGTYRQLLTLPAGYTLLDVVPKFYISTGTIIYPSVEYVSATTAYVYINDNTIDVKVTCA